MSRALWIFGYGSLVWRPAFPYTERRPGFIVGWARRFWQGSTDHRGVPGAPGRVVTLVAERGARCFGMAYRVAEAERRGVLQVLDAREVGGYDRLELPLYFAPDEPPRATALTYVATPRNHNYLGPAMLPEIAAQVRAATGPSGTNLEYVLRLADALRGMDADDPHVFQLEALVRRSAPQ